RQQAVLDFGWAHVNTHHVRNLPASVCAARAGHAGIVAVAQAGVIVLFVQNLAVSPESLCL
ncbi:MAG: hypothetical protein PCALPYG88_7089, partial [uncultured Paraburkholderia sp.]